MTSTRASDDPSGGERGIGWRLAAIIGAQGAITGVLLPFFPVWLAWRGFTETEIALLLTVPIAARVVVTPVLATIADRYVHPARVLLALCLVTAFGFVLLPALDDKFTIAIVFALIGFAQAPGLVFGDILITAAAERVASLNYGHVRLWASVTFLSANLATGVLVGALGPQVVGPALALTAFAGVATALLHPGVRGGGPHGVAPMHRAAPNVRPSAMLLLIIVAAASTQASHAALYAFASIHWATLGWSGPAIGGLWALGVVAEILLFIVAGHLVRSVRAGIVMLAAGGAASAIRFAAMAFDPGTVPTILLQVLHAGSFGATHLGTIALLSALAPPGQRARIQALFIAVNAVLMGFGTLASGPAYRLLGGLSYLGMVPLGLIGLVLSLVVLGMAKAQQSPHNSR